jgi:hypothetical protein
MQYNMRYIHLQLFFSNIIAISAGVIAEPNRDTQSPQLSHTGISNSQLSNETPGSSPVVNIEDEGEFSDALGELEDTAPIEDVPQDQIDTGPIEDVPPDDIDTEQIPLSPESDILITNLAELRRCEYCLVAVKDIIRMTTFKHLFPEPFQEDLRKMARQYSAGSVEVSTSSSGIPLSTRFFKITKSSRKSIPKSISDLPFFRRFFENMFAVFLVIHREFHQISSYQRLVTLSIKCIEAKVGTAKGPNPTFVLYEEKYMNDPKPQEWSFEIAQKSEWIHFDQTKSVPISGCELIDPDVIYDLFSKWVEQFATNVQGLFDKKLKPKLRRLITGYLTMGWIAGFIKLSDHLTTPPSRILVISRYSRTDDASDHDIFRDIVFPLLYARKKAGSDFAVFGRLRIEWQPIVPPPEEGTVITGVKISQKCMLPWPFFSELFADNNAILDTITEGAVHFQKKQCLMEESMIEWDRDSDKYRLVATYQDYLNYPTGSLSGGSSLGGPLSQGSSPGRSSSRGSSPGRSLSRGSSPGRSLSRGSSQVDR